MKSLARKIVLRILNSQVRRLLKKNKVKVIAVVGSVGKTTTKMAIADALATKHKLRYQSGNYNDPVTVPLVFFDLPLPNLFNPIAWLAVFLRAEIQIRQRYEYEFVVLEFGIDGPGQMRQFANCVQPDLTVVTALSLEHMEEFDSLEEVAKEELVVAQFSEKLLVNADMCSEELLSGLESPYQTYGYLSGSDFLISNAKFISGTARFEVALGRKSVVVEKLMALSEVQLYAPSAAIAVALMNGYSESEASKAVAGFKPVNGRLNVLKGIKSSTIIDDTYNASPEAMKAALAILYGYEISMNGAKKIALLGNMNELGDFSVEAHKMIGDICKPEKVDLVVTLGPEANKYIASRARANGCEVIATETPYEAGDLIREALTPGSVILFKGSQNKVFAEEAVKYVLDNEDNQRHLVRQSETWLKKKKASFDR